VKANEMNGIGRADQLATEISLPHITASEKRACAASSAGDRCGIPKAVPSAYSPPRRGIRRNEAALYVGVSGRKFDQMVRDGWMPKPKRVDGCVLWDLRALDTAFDALDSPYEANEWD
jgi:predicted DNA-binding transcriptional regulator AlpA